MSWQKAIILNLNEQVLHSWDGNCERHHKEVVAKKSLITTRYETKQAKEIHSGTLVLTNQRLLWFERRGFLSKTERSSFDIDLRTLKGITAGGALAKWVSITDRDAEYIFHLKGVGKKEIEPFRDMILRHVEKLKMGTTETINVSIRKEIIRKDDVPPIWVCYYCKGKNFMTLTECKHCGAPRKSIAQDNISVADPDQIPE